MYKIVIFVLLVFGLTPVSVAGEWYAGGTLSSAGILEWQQATAENKLASSADMVALLYQEKLLKPVVASKIQSMDDLKPLARDLVNCLNESTKPAAEPAENQRLFLNQSVGGFAAVCISLMGWAN